MAALRIEFIEMQLQPVTGNAAAHASALPTLCFFSPYLPCKSIKDILYEGKKRIFYFFYFIRKMITILKIPLYITDYRFSSQHV